MTIGYYIRQLLEQGKKVILPGFGYLEVKDPGSTFPASGKKIPPPGKSVVFDSSFSKDDGLLAKQLFRKEDIDPLEADQQVLELVDAIKFSLDKGETYQLLDAGTFSRNEDSKILFEPDKEWVLEPDQFGLESMDLIELDDTPEDDIPEDNAPEDDTPEDNAEPGKAEKGDKPAESPGEEKEEESAEEEVEKTEEPPAKSEEKKVKEEPVAVVTSPPPPPPPPPAPPETKETPRRKFRIWKVIWIIAGILIVILVALIIIPREKLDEWSGMLKKEPVDAQEQTVADSAEVIPEMPGADQAEEAVDQEEQEETQVTESGAQQDEAPPPEDIDKYFIIAGSFTHPGNARDKQEELTAAGFKAGIMKTEDRKYRVSVASFPEKAEAERELRRLKSEGMEIWLLSNE